MQHTINHTQLLHLFPLPLSLMIPNPNFIQYSYIHYKIWPAVKYIYQNSRSCMWNINASSQLTQKNQGQPKLVLPVRIAWRIILYHQAVYEENLGTGYKACIA